MQIMLIALRYATRVGAIGASLVVNYTRPIVSVCVVRESSLSLSGDQNRLNPIACFVASNMAS